MIKFLNEDPNLDMHASKSSRPSLVELQLITGISQVNYDSHFHKHCEILLLERGKGNALIDGKSFDIEPNSLIIFNPRIPHKENYFCTDGDIVLWSLNITDYQHINFVNGEQDNLLPADIPPVLAISAADAKEYSSLMKKIKAEYREKLPKYKEVCEAIADELLLLILRQYHMRYHIFKTMKSGYTRDIDFARAYIDEHYAASNISIEEICKLLFMSPSYFSHIFKSELNISPFRYITRKRMEKAQELLCSTTLSISEIAAATGYDSVHNFYKLFKKYNNSTPNEFRKKFR